VVKENLTNYNPESYYFVHFMQPSGNMSGGILSKLVVEKPMMLAILV
jgi:hypothetical protein